MVTFTWVTSRSGMRLTQAGGWRGAWSLSGCCPCSARSNRVRGFDSFMQLWTVERDPRMKIVGR